MYYRLNQDKTIKDCAHYQYAEDCLQTDKNIVHGFDGNLYFEEDVNMQGYIDRKNEFQRRANNIAKIEELKKNLFDTDYQVLKWKEGELNDEDFEPMRQQRKAWREEIRELEKLI